MNTPTAVILTLRDGTTLEQVYPTRWLAEWYIYLIPYLMTTGAVDVAEAILSPLVKV